MLRHLVSRHVSSQNASCNPRDCEIGILHAAVSTQKSLRAAMGTIVEGQLFLPPVKFALIGDGFFYSVIPWPSLTRTYAVIRPAGTMQFLPDKHIALIVYGFIYIKL